MKLASKITVFMLTLGTGVTILAQDAPPPSDAGPREGGFRPARGPAEGRHRPPLMALMGALDANHDGIVDADEIANATEALKKLDKNGDGMLTPDELMGPRPTALGADGSAATQDGPPPAEAGRQAPGANRGPIPRAGESRHRPPPIAVIGALDANHDGVVDANEITNAPDALKKLDKNSDGVLTPDELMGPRPQGMRPGGPGPRPDHGDENQQSPPPQQ